MSYDLRLMKDGKVCEAGDPHAIAGGTYALGGTSDLKFNITYNYSPFFRAVLGPDGIRSIYGMTALASLPVLDRAAQQLFGLPDPDYWAATEGNARKALLNLIELARMAPPDAVWEGD